MVKTVISGHFSQFLAICDNLWPFLAIFCHFFWLKWSKNGQKWREMPFGVQNGPKMGQKGAQNGLKWPKMVKISKIFRFSVSAGNALNWYPNGLKRSQNTFLWPVDPLLAHFGRFPPAFWASQGHLGPKWAQKGAKKGPKWPKMTQNGQNIEIFPILSFGWKCAKMVSKWSKTVSKHICMAC